MAYSSPINLWAVGFIMAELYTTLPLFSWSYETVSLSTNSHTGAVTEHGLLQPYRRVGSGLHHGRAVHHVTTLLLIP
jgi:hypothetical protein